MGKIPSPRRNPRKTVPIIIGGPRLKRKFHVVFRGVVFFCILFFTGCIRLCFLKIRLWHQKSFLSGDHYLTVGWWEWAGGWWTSWWVHRNLRNPGTWLPNLKQITYQCLTLVSCLCHVYAVILSGSFIHFIPIQAGKPFHSGGCCDNNMNKPNEWIPVVLYPCPL